MTQTEMPAAATVALPPLAEAIEASRRERVRWRDCRSLVSWNTILSGLCALALWGLVWDGHWDAALVLLLSFYTHEAGHLLAAVRLGIPVVLSPLFTVGGARVFVSHSPYDRGAGLLFYLAGPLAGAAFASGVIVYGAATRETPLVQAGVVAVLINLGSLLPSQSSTVISDGMHIVHLLRDREETGESAWPRRRLRWVSYVVGGAIGLGLDIIALAHPSGVVRTAVRVIVIVAAVTAATAAARRVTRWACAPDRPKAARYLALATCSWVQPPFWTPQSVPLALVALAQARGLPGLALLRWCARSWTRSYPDMAGTACAYGYDLLGSSAERERWLQGQAAAPLTELAILSILTNLAGLGYGEDGARWASAQIARVPVGPLRAPTENRLATVWLTCGRNEEAVGACANGRRGRASPRSGVHDAGGRAHDHRHAGGGRSGVPSGPRHRGHAGPTPAPMPRPGRSGALRRGRSRCRGGPARVGGVSQCGEGRVGSDGHGDAPVGRHRALV